MEQIGFSTKEEKGNEYSLVKEKIFSSLKDFFRPEFMNRLDDVIIFDILSKEAIRKIVDIQIKQVEERLEAKEISLHISVKALDYLAKEGYNPQYGARPLKRLIQTKLLNPIASSIISQGILKGGTVIVDVKNNEITFDVKKGKKGSIVEKETFKEDEE
jgi:ATP-dependent Clp protease ATP-binding subunit ClpA